MQPAPHGWRARCLSLYSAGATALSINNHSSPSSAGSCRKFSRSPIFHFESTRTRFRALSWKGNAHFCNKFQFRSQRGTAGWEKHSLREMNKWIPPLGGHMVSALHLGRALHFNVGINTNQTRSKSISQKPSLKVNKTNPALCEMIHVLQFYG